MTATKWRLARAGLLSLLLVAAVGGAQPQSALATSTVFHKFNDYATSGLAARGFPV